MIRVKNMKNITSRNKKGIVLVAIIFLSIIACLLSERYREPEHIYHLSNVISETQIPSIPFLRFQKSKYIHSKYYVMRYTFDSNAYNRNELAFEIIRRITKAGYKVKVANSTKERFYILAENENFFFEVSVFSDLLSVSVNEK